MQRTSIHQKKRLSNNTCSWQLKDELQKKARRQLTESRTKVSIVLQHGLASFCVFMHLATAGGEENNFHYPISVTATQSGVVYVADRQLPGIWRIDSGITSVFFQGSKTFQTPLNAVRCVAIDHNGQVLAGDSSTRDVYRFDAAGKPTPLANGSIGIPMSIAVAADGTIFTADLELHRIWKMPAEGSSQPEEFAVINSPRGLALDRHGTLWVLSTSSKNGQIQMVRPDGVIVPFVDSHPFRLPHNIVRTPAGLLYVTDNYSRCIWKVSPHGKCEQWLKGRPLDRPVGLCRFNNDLLITDPHIKTVFRSTLDKSLTVFAQSPVRQRVDKDE